jgi:L-asparaginase II
MPISPYQPLYLLKRGEVVESIHYGAAAIVNAQEELIAWLGEPQVVTYLRSSAKPFQALPFLERGGAERFNLTLKEIALLCASHSGSDEHVATVQSIQQKTGVSEGELLCGVHPPYDEIVAERMRLCGEQPTPNRHNCSGKHTGMLAFARMENLPTADYINPSHPIQKIILETFAQMCDLPVSGVAVGIDGCSAPNFAVPLYNAALAFARLCEPSRLSKPRASACSLITRAMTAHPEMVAGNGRFDTRLMQVANGRMIAKAGAEGYQGIGLLPGALGDRSPALGIALKISDGDARGKVRAAVSLEILRQFGALSQDELQALAEFGPILPLYNWRKIAIGEAQPCFQLERNL